MVEFGSRAAAISPRRNVKAARRPPFFALPIEALHGNDRLLPGETG